MMKKQIRLMSCAAFVLILICLLAGGASAAGKQEGETSFSADSLSGVYICDYAEVKDPDVTASMYLRLYPKGEKRQEDKAEEITASSIRQLSGDPALKDAFVLNEEGDLFLNVMDLKTEGEASYEFHLESEHYQCTFEISARFVSYEKLNVSLKTGTMDTHVGEEVFVNGNEFIQAVVETDPEAEPVCCGFSRASYDNIPEGRYTLDTKPRTFVANETGDYPLELAITLGANGFTVNRPFTFHVEPALSEEETQQIEAENNRVREEAAREEEKKQHEAEFPAFVEELEEADQKWAASWPPKGKQEAAKITTHSASDFSQTFYVDFEKGRGVLDSFAPFYLQGEDRQEEVVTEYHVTFLSGEETMRGFYYQGWYDYMSPEDPGDAAINIRWDYITKPGTAEFRIDMVSEHYWASMTANPVIGNAADYSFELLTSDVYIPVGREVNIPEMFDLREFVKTEPRIEYSCGIQVPEGSEEETDSYVLESWYNFTAKKPGDYPLILRAWGAGDGLSAEFPITVHASAETEEAHLEGDAPVSLHAARLEEEQKAYEAKRAEEEKQRMLEYSEPGDETAETEDAVFLLHQEPGYGSDYWGISGIIVRGSELTIPSELNGHKILAVFNNARVTGDDKLKTLTVEEGIQSIGIMAFAHARNLETLTLPGSVTGIGTYAFNGCRSLKQVTLPPALGIDSIAEQAFGGCGLEDITLGDGTSLMAASLEAYRRTGGSYDNGFVMTAAADDFEYLVREDGAALITNASINRDEMVIPGELNGHPVKEIGARAMSNRSMVSLVLPEGLEEISAEAFRDCRSLAQVTFPASLKTIGSGAFSGIAAESLVLPDGVTAAADWYVGSARQDASGQWTYRVMADGTAMIVGYTRTAKLSFPAEADGIPVTVIGGPEAVEGQQNTVTQIEIPEGIRQIGKGAFSYLDKLTKVTLPSTLEVIGESAFEWAPAMKELVIPEGVVRIGDKAFSRWSGLKKLTLPSTLKEIGRFAFNGHAVKELVIPEGVEKIGDSAFYPANEKSLSAVTFRGASTELGKGVFGYVYKGNDVEDSEQWVDWFAENYGAPFTLTIHCWPGSTADRKYLYDVKKNYPKWGEENILTLPADPVAQAGLIAPDAKIYELIVPEGVEEIAENAFADTPLCKVTLPSTLKKIGAGAFKGCTALSGLSLPKGLAEIGDSAFAGCSSLQKIDLPDGITEIPDHAFEDCTALSKVTLPKAGLKRVGTRAFCRCGKLDSLKLPAGLTEIGAYALSSTNLKTASVPDSVVSLGEGAFAATPITSITLPKGLTAIPDRLCMGCSLLKNLTIPAGVETIGEEAFEDCCSLSGVTFPKGLRSIGACAFLQDTEGVNWYYRQTGGKKTYSALKSLKLPASLREIGEMAFGGCDALTSVTFERDAELTKIGAYAFSVCLHLKEITLPDALLTIGDGAFGACYDLKKAVLGKALTETGKQTFLNDSSLAELVVPDTLATIGEKILDGHGNALKVTCGEGSAMEAYLQQNYPDAKIVRPKK